LRKTVVWIEAALLLVAAWFFWTRPQPPKTQPPQEVKTWQAQAPTLQLVSPDGEIQWFLTARRIEFSEDGTMATVDKLQGQLQAQGEKIAVEAPQAIVDWQEQNIEFIGPVQVQGKELSIKAKSLKWQAKDKQLRAWGGVTVTTPTSRLEGQSLSWQQPRGKLVVEGGVRLWATAGAGR
jgi:LPS export ABC transporter protein LptC